jgi:DNA recombination protein RmuC
VPDEGTYDFALMYIAAENVYYETIIKEEGAAEKNLSLYALSKRVIPVSPNSLYAYLQAIVLGLKGMKIEDRAKEIIQYLGRLQTELLRFREDFGLLGRHIGHAQSCYQNTEKRLEQFAEKLLSAESAPAEVVAPTSGQAKIA